MCRPKGYCFLSRLDLKTGIVFVHWFWSGIEYGFRGDYASAWMYSSFQFQMNKKERVIYEVEMIVGVLILVTMT